MFATSLHTIIKPAIGHIKSIIESVKFFKILILLRNYSLLNFAFSLKQTLIRLSKLGSYGNIQN